MLVSKPKTRPRECYNRKTINAITGYPHRVGENITILSGANEEV